MRIIRYYDNGKPLKEPEIWYFQFHAKNNANDDEGDGDEDEVGGSSKNKRLMWLTETVMMHYNKEGMKR